MLSGVSIRARPNLNILGVKFHRKFTFGDHVRGIGSPVSQRIGISMLVKRVFEDTSVLLRCYYAFVLPILEYCSPVWGSAAECHLELLERQVYSVASCALIRAAYRYVIDVMLLGYVCSKWLIRTRITGYQLEYEVSRLECPNLQGLSCLPAGSYVE